MNPQKTSWGKVAKWYDRLLEDVPGTYQKEVILPNLLRIVAPRPGMTIADIACGQGFFARAFFGAGASVVGADIAPELIEIAKKNSPREINFHVAPADNLKEIKTGEADIALIALAIQNIENLAGTMAEVARILKPDGHLILVMNHPAFRIPGETSWGWDEAMKRQYRRVDGYLSEARAEIEMHPSSSRQGGRTEKKSGERTISFHRPLQVYVKALAKAGFAITRLEEWISPKTSEPGPRAKEEDRIRKEIPMFLCLEAKKLG